MFLSAIRSSFSIASPLVPLLDSLGLFSFAFIVGDDIAFVSTAPLGRNLLSDELPAARFVPFGYLDKTYYVFLVPLNDFVLRLLYLSGHLVF